MALVDPKAVIIQVRGLKTGIKLDVKDAVGTNGASLTYQGRTLARFTIELRAGHQSPGYLAEEGYAILCALCEMVFKASSAIVKISSSGGVTTRTSGATPIAVKHPLLATAGVNAMVCEDIDWPEQQDDLSYTASFSCIQYAPPAKLNVSKPLQGDVLNSVGDVFSGAKGAAPASTTSPQLPQPPSATKPKPT